MSGHGISVEVIERNDMGRATSWLATCKCKTRFTEATYEATEDKWRRHVHAVTGTAPKPMGGQLGRWTP